MRNPKPETAQEARRSTVLAATHMQNLLNATAGAEVSPDIAMVSAFGIALSYITRQFGRAHVEALLAEAFSEMESDDAATVIDPRGRLN